MPKAFNPRTIYRSSQRTQREILLNGLFLCALCDLL